jgi:hypothetical protein
MFLQTVTTTTSADPVATAGFLLASVVLSVAAYLLSALPTYGVLKKAAHPDAPAWGAFVPVYNTYCLLKVTGRPWWWLLLILFVPVVNIVLVVMLYHSLSRSFGHGAGFTVGLVLLTVVFLFVLWLGSSRYHGPAALQAPHPQHA